MKLKIKLLLTFQILMLGIISMPHKTEAAGINTEISPVKNYLNVDPGAKNSINLVLKNYSESPTTFNVIARDFSVEGSDGSVKFLDLNQNEGKDQKFSLRKWLTLQSDKIELKPGETVKFKVDIEVPIDAEPGGHYAGVIFESVLNKDDVPSGSNIGSLGRIVPLLIVDVSGDVDQSFELARISNIPTIYDHTKEQRIETEFKNAGSVHQIPTGTISLTGWFGYKQTIKFNDQGAASLPNAPNRIIETKFSLKKINKIIPVIGPVEARFDLDYGHYGSPKMKINKSVSFKVIPVKFLVISSLVFLVVIFVLWRIIVSFKK